MIANNFKIMMGLTRTRVGCAEALAHEFRQNLLRERPTGENVCCPIGPATAGAPLPSMLPGASVKVPPVRALTQMIS